MGVAMKTLRILICLLLLPAGWAAAAFDPTAPPPQLAGGAANAAAAAQQTGLAWVRVNGRHSLAWYGGTTVRLGDPVEGGRVSAIREDHIVISGKSGHRAVYLLDRSIRTQLPTPARAVR